MKHTQEYIPAVIAVAIVVALVAVGGCIRMADYRECKEIGRSTFYCLRHP